MTLFSLRRQRPGIGTFRQGGKSMNIHEYQSKQVLKEFGVKVPNGHAAFNPEETARVAKEN